MWSALRRWSIVISKVWFPKYEPDAVKTSTVRDTTFVGCYEKMPRMHIETEQISGGGVERLGNYGRIRYKPIRMPFNEDETGKTGKWLYFGVF